MYDIAISFAGEDRAYAESIAEQARLVGLDVFYDLFEQSDLWGKDLTVHLDTIYRKNSLFCVVLISENYIKKAWPRHEIRSAFARNLQSEDEYILPIRFDSTDVPGMPETVGYIDGNTTSPEKIVLFLLEKLGVTHVEDNTHADKFLLLGDIKIPCSVFVIDRRYFEKDPPDGWQYRAAVSFGPNITGPEHFGTILAPPIVDTPFCLALHSICTRADELDVIDMWLTAKPYYGGLSHAAAINASLTWLNELSENEYGIAAKDSSKYGNMQISEPVIWKKLV